MDPSIRGHKDTEPIRQTTGLSNDSGKYSRNTFDTGFYSLDDVVIRRNSEVREITNRISRQPQKSSELGDSDAVSAPADICYPDLIEES